MPLTDRREESDAALMARLRRGDPAALDPLYHRHAPAMLRLAHRLLGAREDAEDVVQDVFVGLPLAVRHYEERGTLGAWLRVLTARVAVGQLRARRRRRALAEWLHPGEPRTPPRGQERLELEDAVAALPADLRAVFVLREVEGWSHAEIAALLGIRRGTSEVRLHRALRRLRRWLGEDR